MLVLTRRKGEEIIIPLPAGEMIRIMIVDNQDERVRVGIEAPKSLPVHRKEVFTQIYPAA